MELSIHKMRCVANLGQHLQLVTDSQDVQAICEHLGLRGLDLGYDAFFVDVQDGEYVEVWGMCGTVPYNSKLVSRLVPKGEPELGASSKPTHQGTVLP